MTDSNSKKLCPACGKMTRLEVELCCPNCHTNYIVGAADALIKGRALLEADWVIGMARKLLEDAEKSHDELQNQYDELRRRVPKMLEEKIKSIPGADKLSREVVIMARERMQKDIEKMRNVVEKCHEGVETLKKQVDQAADNKPVLAPRE